MTPGTEYLTLDAAAALLPGPPSYQSVWRWCRVGLTVRSPDGSKDRFRLRCARFGKRVYTTAEWVHEFGGRLAELDRFVPEPEEASEPCPHRMGRTTRIRHIEGAEARVAARLGG